MLSIGEDNECRHEAPFEYVVVDVLEEKRPYVGWLKPAGGVDITDTRGRRSLVPDWEWNE